MGFFTIFVTPGLPPAARRRAHQAGPRAVASSRDHRDLLHAAGFGAVDEIDTTSEFRDTARAWLRESQHRAVELATIETQATFDERQEERRTMLAAIEEGLLRRALFIGMRPRP
jgi:hypothetical protein